MLQHVCRTKDKRKTVARPPPMVHTTPSGHTHPPTHTESQTRSKVIILRRPPSYCRPQPICKHKHKSGASMCSCLFMLSHSTHACLVLHPHTPH
jgi:hypothetical protein